VFMTRKTFSRFDVADYLNSEERIAAYLEVAAEECGDDPVFMARVHDAVARARARIAKGIALGSDGLEDPPKGGGEAP
jgi:DNA-binding phage protein